MVRPSSASASSVSVLSTFSNGIPSETARGGGDKNLVISGSNDKDGHQACTWKKTTFENLLPRNRIIDDHGT